MPGLVTRGVNVVEGGGARGLLGKRTGNVKKHADNKLSLRALLMLAALVAVPVIWLGALNDATKPKPTPTAVSWGAPVTVAAADVAAAPPMAGLLQTSTPGRLSGETPAPTAAPVVMVVTATPLPALPTETLLPTETPTPAPTATPTRAWELWIAVAPIWPDDGPRFCGGTYQGGQCLAGVASGANWRVLSGRGAACPEGLPLGAELVLQGGPSLLCIDRSRKVCTDNICPVYLYVRNPGEWLGPVLARAYVRNVGG